MENAEEGNLPSSPKKKGSLLSILGAILGLGLIGVLVWFLVEHSYPKCYIDKFDVYALKQTTNSFHHSNTIHFGISLINQRSEDEMGVYYDTLNFTFYYKHNLSSYLVIGNASIDPFYQRSLHWITYRDGNFEASDITWGNVTTPAIFRVELVTATRFKKVLWKTKRRHMVVGADIRVNDKGRLVKQKRLKSNDASLISRKSPLQLHGILITLIIVHSW